MPGAHFHKKVPGAQRVPRASATHPCRKRCQSRWQNHEGNVWVWVLSCTAQGAYGKPLASRSWSGLLFSVLLVLLSQSLDPNPRTEPHGVTSAESKDENDVTLAWWEIKGVSTNCLRVWCNRKIDSLVPESVCSTHGNAQFCCIDFIFGCKFKLMKLIEYLFCSGCILRRKIFSSWLISLCVSCSPRPSHQPPHFFFKFILCTAFHTREEIVLCSP